jgi:hypothetical protein
MAQHPPDTAEVGGDDSLKVRPFRAARQGSDPNLIHQWRKHPNLHGWMEALYEAWGGLSIFSTANRLCWIA